MDRNELVFPIISEKTWDADRISTFTHDLREASTIDGNQAPVGGSLLLSSDIVAAMKADGPKATALGLGAVLLITLLTFRVLGLSLATMVSLVLSAIIMLGAMAWTGQRMNFSNFVAIPITFGIGADYVFNVLKRYQADAKFDLRMAIANTGGAVAMCSITTIFGFGSLLVAQNKALFSFGLFTTTGEVTGLLTAVMSLPAALLILGARTSK
jgi:predicted RND superfamily exporter protein